MKESAAYQAILQLQMSGQMLSQFYCRLLIISIFLQPMLASASRAEQPATKKEGPANWPEKVVVAVGDIRTRIDGPKMWTLLPTMKLAGDSFRMERRSKIRALDLDSTISIRDGVLIETARFRATGPIDLQSAYPWMYAWTPQATVYVFGDAHGIQKRGVFLKEGQTTSQVVKNATWMAVFNPATRKGSVCCFLKHPPNAEGWFLLVDAPGFYRKVAAYTLVDKVVPQGFDGTYQSAVGFFTATKSDWEERAQRRAAELQASEID
jgi:hypothetical protein